MLSGHYYLSKFQYSGSVVVHSLCFVLFRNGTTIELGLHFTLARVPGVGKPRGNLPDHSSHDEWLNLRHSCCNAPRTTLHPSDT